MSADLIERLRAACMRTDWNNLPDDACIPAVPLLREAADALATKDIALSGIPQDHAAARQNFHTMQHAANALRQRAEAAEAALSEMRKALEEIRRKVHVHNRGGGLSLLLRKEIRDIADATLLSD